jgi:hypothetical protein
VADGTSASWERPGATGEPGLGTAAESPLRRIRGPGIGECRIAFVWEMVGTIHAAHAAADIEAAQKRVAPFPCTAIRQYDFRRGWFQFSGDSGPSRPGLAVLLCIRAVVGSSAALRGSGAAPVPRVPRRRTTHVLAL